MARDWLFHAKSWIVFHEHLLDYPGNARELPEKAVSSGLAREQISLQTALHTENQPP
jgi:hypothetical protein